MKASRLFSIGDFKTVEVDKPTPKGEEILVKIGACGVCGSDLPRIYEHGTSSGVYPLTIGHEFCGEIVEVGDKVDKSYIGKRGAIFPLIPCMKCDSCTSGHYVMCEHYNYMGSRCDGGFADYCLVPSTWHFVESKNKNLSDEDLCMTEPCCVAQHAIRKSLLTAGETCVVFGAGPIGIMAARWAKIFGAKVVLLVDVVDEKVVFARERGMDCVNSMKCDIVEELKKRNDGKLANVVIEGTGSSPALESGIFLTKALGRIVLMGNPTKDTHITLKAHSNIMRKEITLFGMWNNHFNNTPINEWTYTVEMMDAGVMKVSDLITHKSNLDDLPKLIEGIHNRTINICKAMYSSHV